MTLDKLTSIGGFKPCIMYSLSMDSLMRPQAWPDFARWATEVLRCARIEEQFIALSIHAIF
jgi:hypothetical protein